MLKYFHFSANSESYATMTLRGDCVAKKLKLVDMYGIGVMLEYLVAEDNLTCEERDRVILRIAQENDIA